MAVASEIKYLKATVFFHSKPGIYAQELWVPTETGRVYSILWDQSYKQL